MQIPFKILGCRRWSVRCKLKIDVFTHENGQTHGKYLVYIDMIYELFLLLSFFFFRIPFLIIIERKLISMSVKVDGQSHQLHAAVRRCSVCVCVCAKENKLLFIIHLMSCISLIECEGQSNALKWRELLSYSATTIWNHEVKIWWKFSLWLMLLHESRVSISIFFSSSSLKFKKKKKKTELSIVNGVFFFNYKIHRNYFDIFKLLIAPV